MSDNIDVLRRALARERAARKAAEQILEEKSLELFESNSALSEAAKQLRLEAERREILLETASDAIISVWSDNTITLFNAAAERTFGYLRQEVIGRKITELNLEGSAEQRQLSFERLHDDGDEQRQILAQSRDGPRVWMELTSSRVQFDDREAVTMVIRNISRRKTLEKQLHHAQKMESVGQLASGIAHEINTPIQFVSDNCRFLQDAFGDVMEIIRVYKDITKAAENGEETRQLIETVKDEAKTRDLPFLTVEIPDAIDQSLEGIKRVVRIVSAMKDFSHPGQRKKQLVDLNRIIESTSIVCTNEWKYCAKLVTQLDPRLPLVDCLGDEIQQVILNLTVNAAHAIEARRNVNRDGDVPVADRGQITITTVKNGNFAELRVADTGLGIPPEIQDKIFDPFFTTKEVGKGTGQGLAICYSVIVEMHGGTIHFETLADKGTTFVIRLPLKPQTSENQETHHEKTDPVCR